MRRRWIAAVVAAAGIASAALAAEPEEKKPEGPKPPPEVEQLSYFLGPWTSEGEMKPGPMGPGGPTQGRDICRWMPGHFFVGCMMESRSPAGIMQVQAIMGYDPEKKVYRWWSFDNVGRAETATGTLKDGTWTWLGESKLGDKMVKTRYTISDTKPEGYAFLFESSPGGKAWTPMMTGKVSKMVPKTGVTPGVRPVGTPAPSGPPALQPTPPAPVPTKNG